MTTPKVEFKVSWIYNEQWKEWIKLYPRWAKLSFPDYKEVSNYVKNIEPRWRKVEKRILGEMSKVSGLKWKDKVITCYVVGRAIPFSDPLTIGTYGDKDWFMDTLTHELIHQLFIQKGNEERASKSWSYIYRKYKKESHKVKIHAPLHAIHEHIYRTVTGENRLKRELEFMKKISDYGRSWNLVQEEGYQNIIREFRKRLKS